MKVQFRKFRGEILAVFPYEVETDTCVMCYAHIGQHSSCLWNINSFSKPAKEDEYLSLLKELQFIGYENIEVIKRRNHNLYLKAYYDTKNNGIRRTNAN